MEEKNYGGIIAILILIVLGIILNSVSVAVVDSDQFENLTLTTQFSDSGSLDAFGRLRVAEVTGILDVKQLGDKDPLFIDEEINGTATASYIHASTQMNTSTAGDFVVRQTFQRAFYQNAKSQQIFSTFDDFHPETNIIKRIGYFTSSPIAPFNTDYDGLFLSSEDGTVYTNVYLSGSIRERVAQEDWEDPLDGTGASGVTVDWAMSHILLIDFEWLGVGRVRWNLVIDGHIINFHNTNNANNIDGVYMLSPNKPLRWEIRQTGAGSGSFSHICGSVGTEGSINSLGVERSVNTGVTPISAQTIGTKYVIIGLKLNETSLDTVTDVLRFSIFPVSNTNYYWELQLNPVLNTPPTWVDLEESGVDYFLGQSTVTTNGIVLDSGYGEARTVSSDNLDNALRLGASIKGESDILVLVASPLKTGMNIHGSLTFREVR